MHITPPDEHAYLQAVWPGGPVGGGDVAAQPGNQAHAQAHGGAPGVQSAPDQPVDGFLIGVSTSAVMAGVTDQG